MRRAPAGSAMLLALLTAACVSGGEPAGPPNFTPPTGDPAPPRARLYADCIAQAVGADTYDRTSESDSHLIRFNCSGAPARVFFDALQAWSAERKSQWTAEGRVWRSTNRVRRDLFGVDYCSAADDGSDHRCVVVLNAGDFLAGGPRQP